MLLHKFQSYSFLSKKTLGVLVLIVVLVSILEIWLVNRLSTYGEQIAQIEKSAQDLQMQNQILKNEIDKKSSLSQVQNQAESLGFDKIKNIQYLTPVDVAYNSR